MSKLTDSPFLSRHAKAKYDQARCPLHEAEASAETARLHELNAELLRARYRARRPRRPGWWARLKGRLLGE